MSRLLKELRDGGIELAATADGKLRVKAAAATLSAECKAEILKHRAELLAALEAERTAQAERAKRTAENRDRRRASVLEMLERKPALRYGWLTEPGPFGDVVVALAIRGVGTCELTIPKKRYDAGKLLELIAASEASP